VKSLFHINITNVMYDSNLSNNPATALTAGTSAALTFSEKADYELMKQGKSLRAVSAVALTAPHTLQIGHSVRYVDVVFASTKVKTRVAIDRHLVRFDKVCLTPTLGLYDPEYKITCGFQGVWEVPRIGADSPAYQLLMDQYMRVGALTNPSSNAGLIELCNGGS
jgi:hypothetical protein